MPTVPSDSSAFPDWAIFRGSVSHRRRVPHDYRFRQPLFMLFVNTARIDALSEKIRPLARLGILNWRRQDYLPATNEQSLTDSALAALEQLSGIRAAGPVYLLAQPRQFGSAYNPAAFYFICDGTRTRAAHLLVEVHNTPWQERFCYAGHYPAPPNSNNDMATSTMQKRHRVSPFNPMDMTYEWRYNQPRENFFIHMRCYHHNTLHFNAALFLARHPFTRRALAAALMRHPFSSLAATVAIYRHALRLWLRKTPFYRNQLASPPPVKNPEQNQP